MLSPEGEPQCNRCRKPLAAADVPADLLAFCSVECRCEHQISNGFVRIDGAYIETVRPRKIEQPTVTRRKRLEQTDEFQREDVQRTRWKTALWVVLAMCVAFKLATVYLQWQRGEGITFAGRVVVRPEAHR